MVNCSFCKGELARGTGKMFVRRDGSALYFCSTKCQRNMMKLGRSPRKTLWLTKRQPGMPKAAHVAAKAATSASVNKPAGKGGKK